MNPSVPGQHGDSEAAAGRSDTDSLIADLSALPEPVQALTAQQHAQAQEQLRKDLVAYLKDEYRIVDSRFFVDAKPQWVVAERFFAGELRRNPRASQEQQAWNRPGHDLYSVWAIDGRADRRIALAMSYQRLPDGGRVIGYFDLAKN